MATHDWRLKSPHRLLAICNDVCPFGGRLHGIPSPNRWPNALFVDIIASSILHEGYARLRGAKWGCRAVQAQVLEGRVRAGMNGLGRAQCLAPAASVGPRLVIQQCDNWAASGWSPVKVGPARHMINSPNTRTFLARVISKQRGIPPQKTPNIPPRATRDTTASADCCSGRAPRFRQASAVSPRPWGAPPLFLLAQLVLFSQFDLLESVANPTTAAHSLQPPAHPPPFRSLSPRNRIASYPFAPPLALRHHARRHRPPPARLPRPFFMVTRR